MKKSNKYSNSVGILTGGWDPLHASHLELFKEARDLVDIVCVYVNSDAWLKRKKGKAFMDQAHRAKILESLKYIDFVFCFNDQDDADGSSSMALVHASKMFPDRDLYFMNGGDRTKDNIPETDIANKVNAKLLFGIGGEVKGYSSSSLLSDWSYENVERNWGNYKVLANYATCKVKELVINPGQSISKQFHSHRTEDWYITHGKAQVFINGRESVLETGDHICVSPYVVHKITNNTNDVLKIIEVQRGQHISEEDIVRLDGPKK